MNITLSADKNLLEKSRAYAKKCNTTLNELVRDYLQRLVSENETKQAAIEFAELARKYAGKSSAAYKFDRNEIYRRRS